MNIIKKLLGIVLLLLSLPVSAAIIRVELTVESAENQTDYFPLNTLLTFSYDYDVSDGPTVVATTVSVISGAVTWNDGVGRQWIANAGGTGGVVSAVGSYSRFTGGNGPVVNELWISEVGVIFDLGVNPFSTTEKLSDLLLNSTIPSAYIILTGNGGSVTTLPVLSHSISAVPVPAAVWLFGSGLIGLVGFARRKKHNGT